MPEYETTVMPIDALTNEQLRDPVLVGPGTGELAGAADGYRALHELLTTAHQDVRTVLTMAQGAHEGAAAVAANHHGTRVTAVGELLAGQASLAHETLYDAVEYNLRVRHDMESLPDEWGGDERTYIDPDKAELRRVAATDAAHRYEDNSNFSAQRRLQLFEAPEIASPGTTVAALGGPVGGSGGSGIGVGAAGGISALPVGGPGGVGSGGAGPVGSGPASGGPVGALPVTGPAGGPDAVAATPGGVAGRGPAGAPGGAPAPGAGTGPGAGSAATRPGGSRGGRPPAADPASVAPSGGLRPGNVARGAGDRPVGGPSAADARSPGAPGRTGGDADGRPGGGAGRSGAGAAGPSGWVPGTPWSSRPTAQPGPVPTPGEPGRGTPGTPPAGTATGASARPVGPGPAGGVPLVPGAAGAGQNGETHRRPPWLVMDDPEAFWLGGLPAFGPGVIGEDTPLTERY